MALNIRVNTFLSPSISCGTLTLLIAQKLQQLVLILLTWTEEQRHPHSWRAAAAAATTKTPQHRTSRSVLNGFPCYSVPLMRSQLLQANHVLGPRREELKWPSRNLARLPSSSLLETQWACVKLQAGIYVTALETGRRILGCFRNTHIKQKLNQGLGGKIYAMEDRETILSLLWRTQTLPTRICISEQLGVFWLTDTENGIGVFSFLCGILSASAKKSHYY